MMFTIRKFHICAPVLREGLRIPPLYRVDSYTARNLFKYIRDIDIKFFPLDDNSRSARELFRQMNSNKLALINPKCKVKLELEHRNLPAIASIIFVDGSKLELQTGEYNVEELKSEIWQQAIMIQNNYEDEGKNIDDEL
mmetsp:Transcript_13665/g.17992  ORF Transcript_13665/g.17992 Transcript_13665/m.17992 type:complete len:139 (-) Transcript_13665:225-641(-)